jgi:hypothetical protein
MLGFGHSREPLPNTRNSLACSAPLHHRLRHYRRRIDCGAARGYGRVGSRHVHGEGCGMRAACRAERTLGTCGGSWPRGLGWAAATSFRWCQASSPKCSSLYLHSLMARRAARGASWSDSAGKYVRTPLMLWINEASPFSSRLPIRSTSRCMTSSIRGPSWSRVMPGASVSASENGTCTCIREDAAPSTDSDR